MSRRQNPSSNPVPLFQFLDLFLCTIGTLIVMLVIMTTKIRQDTVNRAIAERIVASETDRTPELESAAPALLILPEPATSPVTTDSSAAIDHQAAVSDAIERLHDLEKRSTTLNGELLQRQRAITSLEQQARLTVAETQAASASKKELERRLREAITERNKELAELQQLKNEQSRLREKILESQKLIAVAKQKEGNSEYVIVPYDGITGTTRRPIFIECKDATIRFAAEDVTINLTDMEPFRPGADPLAAGIAELVQYWVGKSKAPDAAKPESQPYVLVIVRPSGLPAYLLTRRSLDATGVDFGYELVTEDFSFAAPESEPRAKELCQATVTQTIKDGPKAPTARVYVLGEGHGSAGGSGAARRSSPSRPSSGSRGSSGGGRNGPSGSQTASRSGPSSVRQYGGIDSGALSRGGTGSLKFFSSTSFQDHRERIEVGSDDVPAPSSTRKPGELQLSDDDAPLMPARPEQRSVAAATPGIAANIKPPASTAAETKSETMASQTPTQSTEPLGVEDLSPQPRPTSSTTKSKSSARGGTAGSAARSQSSGEETIDEQAEESPLMKDRDIKNLSAFKRQWGVHNPKGSIALEKKLTVALDGQKIIVGNRLKITRFEDRTNKQLADLTILAIDEVAKDWGPPPEQFYWVPTVDLSIYAGGEIITEPLRKALQQTGVVVNVLYQ